MRKRIGTNKMDETKQIGNKENWTGQGIRKLHGHTDGTKMGY